MIHPIVVFFLLMSSIFAGVHYAAMVANLYSYFWWFDIVMHFWGGLLLGLGVHAFSTFSWLRYRPVLPVVLGVLALATGLWEIFEGAAGLHDQDVSLFVIDTTQDILLGFTGGLLAHALLRHYTMKGHD